MGTNRRLGKNFLLSLHLIDLFMCVGVYRIGYRIIE